MTITSTRYLGIVTPDVQAIQNGSVKPPQRVWHAVDPPFKGYQPPPSEGHEKSSGDTAIVIDNGEHGDSERYLKYKVWLILLQAPVSFEPAGPSIMLLESLSHLRLPGTGIGSLTGLVHMLATMRTPTQRPEDRCVMPLSREPAWLAIGM